MGLREGFLDLAISRAGFRMSQWSREMGGRPAFHGEATHERLGGMRGLETSVKHYQS